MHKTWILGILLGAVFLGSGGMLLWQHLHPPAEGHIVIVQDNQVLETLDFPTSGTRTFRITAPDGGWNDITIQDGSICISDADCPDKTCVKSGMLHSENLPLVCLPHKLVIRWEASP